MNVGVLAVAFNAMQEADEIAEPSVCSKRMVSRFFTALLVCLTASVFTACTTESDPQPSSGDASSLAAVTPESLAAELEPAATLSGAAAQLAGRLGADVDGILVRIQSRDCSVCKVDASAVEYPDMPVDDAASRLEPSDKLWLVVQDLTCYYYYDGKTVSPLACSQSETVE